MVTAVVSIRKYLAHESLTLVAGQTLQVKTRVGMGMNLMKYSRT